MSGVAINILFSDILFFIACPCAVFTNNSRSKLLRPLGFYIRFICFLHLLKPLNICHEPFWRGSPSGGVSPGCCPGCPPCPYFPQVKSREKHPKNAPIA
ncbi:MAG: hypothetical protein V8Q06_02755 [Acutalibacteraceae bacterium]